MLDRLMKLREERTDSDKGFTLIELLVVVVIIGILIAIAIPLYLNYTKSAKQKSAESDLRNAVATLEQCNSDNSVYPSRLTAVGTPVTSYTACTGQSVNVSTGNALAYSPSATAGASYVLESAGTDKTIFCYDSTIGGSVRKTAATATSTRLTACPA